MNITNVLESKENVILAVSKNDLEAWHAKVIESTRRELEQSIKDSKAETLYTRKEIIEILKVNASTLWRWAKSGYLVPISIGGKRVYRSSDIDAILNQKTR